MPVGAVRIGKVDGNFVVNPKEEDLHGEQRPRPRRGRHRGGHPHGRGRRERDPRGRDPRRARHRPRRDPQALRRPARAGRRRPASRSSTVEAPQIDEGLLEQIRASHGAQLDEATQVADKLERQDATKAVEEAVLDQYSGDPETDTLRRVPPEGAARVRPAREADHPPAHRRREEAPRRPRREGDPPDLDRGRRRAAHARLGALHARPDAGPVGRRARHAEGGDAPRHPRARDEEVLLAPLQLPAVLGGRGRLHARPQAP